MSAIDNDASLDEDRVESKLAAQVRVNQIRAFDAERALLQTRGLLTLSDAQLHDIHTYHQQVLRDLQQHQDVDLTERARHLSLGTQIVAFLGAAAFAASVFFLFYQYWGLFSLLQQVCLLVAAPLVTLGAACWVKQRDASGYYAKLVATVSFVCFVLNLVMLGTVFNIIPSPNAFATYAIYGFLLAYLFSGRLLLVAALVCSFTYIAAKTTTWVGGIYWVYLWEYPEHFLLPAVLFFALPFLKPQQRCPEFKPIYHIISVGAFFLAVLILSHWGRGSYLRWDANIIEGFYQLIGFAASAGLIVLGLRRQDSLLMLLGNICFAIFLCSKFFDWWWDWMPKSLFFLVMGLTMLLTMMVFKRLRQWQQLSLNHQEKEIAQ
jgi:uncharacterized membrane protein